MIFPGPNERGALTWQQYHRGQHDKFAGIGPKSDMVVELRVPFDYGARDRQDVVDFCKKNGCYCSWGIEDAAGVGWVS